MDVVDEREDMMNLVRMAAIRMIEEKKDGRNCWHDEVDEGEECGVDDFGMSLKCQIVNVL